MRRCSLAGTLYARYGSGSWVARNGAVIEQAQLLTTHNLAVPTTNRRARLQAVKNCAYAWRQWSLATGSAPAAR